MGKILSSSPAWVKASWISRKNSGSRDGATVATAWRRAGSDRAGMGISGSPPCGYSAVIQPASSHIQQQKTVPRLGAESGYSLARPQLSLRTVAGEEEISALPWTDSPGQWGQSGVSGARLGGFRAVRAPGAPRQAPHNPPFAGSSPTRPTRATSGNVSGRRCRFRERLQLALRLAPQRLAYP